MIRNYRISFWHKKRKIKSGYKKIISKRFKIIIKRPINEFNLNIMKYVFEENASIINVFFLQ